VVDEQLRIEHVEVLGADVERDGRRGRLDEHGAEL
jgi:hypothetical protein